MGSAIENILDQHFQDYELLLIDNGSTEGSLAIAQSYLKDTSPNFKGT